MTMTIWRTFFTLLSLTVLASCGGGGGTTESNNNTDRILPSVNFTVVPPDAVATGSSVQIAWQANNVNSCEASGDWSGSKTAIGNEMLTSSESGDKTYTLTCTGEGGSVSDTITFSVLNAPQLSLDVSAEQVALESQFEISWQASDAENCVAEGDWTGDKSTSGNANLVESDSGQKHYTLTCDNAVGSVTQTVTVEVVLSPIITFEASSTSLPADSEFTLNWSVAGADSCVANGDWSGEQPTNGSASFVETLIGTNVYHLLCTGVGGETSQSLEIELTNPLTVSISSIDKAPLGVDLVINWSSTDAQSCRASGDWSGDKSTSGSEVMQFDTVGERNFFLTCRGDRGEVQDARAVDIYEYEIDTYHGTQIPDFVDQAPSEVEYFESTVDTAGQLEGLGHQQTAERGAGKFVFNRVYRAVKHGLPNYQQFGIFGSWLHSYDNNSIEGGLWVNPKTTGPQYYPSLHLAGIGDTYYACNDVTMGGGLYEKVLGDRWLTLFQISNRVLSIPGMNIGFDMHQTDYAQDNGIWVGSGWSYLNLDHPRDYKFWLSFIETYDYQGPINGYIPEHFNWVDPEKVEEGSYAFRLAAGGDNFGTFATLGSRPNGGNGNERVSMAALDLGEGNYYVPTDFLPIEKQREYVLAYPQSIEQSTMEAFSTALKNNTLESTLIATDFKAFESVYKSSHNQLKMLEEIDDEQHMHMVVPPYEVGYSGNLGFVDWDFSTEAKKAKLQQQNGYIYIRKTDEKYPVEQYADPYYSENPHIYKTELIDAPDEVVRAPKVEYRFYNYKERDASNPEFANWDTTGMKRHQVVLQSGAVATYVWFKFIDQPALKTARQNHPEVYTEEYLETLQGYIETLHRKVAQSTKVNPQEPVFISYSQIEDGESSEFNLAKIDPAQLVTPEQDHAVGYVPVVISVYHPQENSMNGLGLEAAPDPICTNDEWTDTYYPDIE